MEEIAEKYNFLSKANMKGMPDINIWKILYCWFESIDVGADFIHFFGRLIKAMFHNYDCKGSGDIAFVYTNALGWERQDHVQNFQNLCSTQEEKKVIMPYKGYKLNKYVFKNLKNMYLWYKEGIRCGLKKKQAADFAVKVLGIKSEGDSIYELISNSKYVVTYCDVLPPDYYVTYLANRNEKMSITVQHGFYAQGGYQFTHSESKIFITDTLVGYEFASKSGVKHPVVGGMMSEMYEEEKREISNNGVFAVVLDGSNSIKHYQDNVSMLNYSEILAMEFNLKYILRYHPANEKMIHNENNKNIGYISTKTEKINSLLNKVDFVIVNQSTTYFQSISILVPVFRFIGICGNTMPLIHTGVFSNYDELRICFSEYEGMGLNDMRKQKHSVIGTLDIFCQYSEIFNNIRMKNT